MSQVENAAEALQEQGVRLVACTFVDNAGVTRVKNVPIYRLSSAARKGIGISTLFTVFALDDHITTSEGFDTPSGDMRLVPDLDSAVVLGSAPGWAWAPVNQYNQEGEVLPVCQRSVLRQVVDRAAEKGITFQMAYEPEFSLLDEDGNPLHNGPGYSPWALIPAQKYAVDLINVLEQQGIFVEQFHPEYSMGQYEISVAPQSPVQAADHHILLRLTIRWLGRQHDYMTSFAPLVFPDAVGNGSHLHFSAWRDDDNLMTGGEGPEGLTRDGEALAAGVLHHLPSLIGIFAPSVLSYQRLQPSHWSGAYACWGWENREAALRLVKGTASTRDRSANFELKTIDGTSNPYLAAAMVIAAAMDGLERQLELPKPIQVDPATLSDDERASNQILRLPTSLKEAITELEKSSLARETLGDRLYEAFVAVRQLEWDTYGEKEVAELVDLHRWRYG